MAIPIKGLRGDRREVAEKRGRSLLFNLEKRDRGTVSPYEMMSDFSAASADFSVAGKPHEGARLMLGVMKKHFGPRLEAGLELRSAPRGSRLHIHHYFEAANVAAQLSNKADMRFAAVLIKNAIRNSKSRVRADSSKARV
ncbi:MAG: hypothetical protein ABIG96_02550 [Candidatus Micrarchaeota archaeon]